MRKIVTSGAAFIWNFVVLSLRAAAMPPVSHRLTALMLITVLLVPVFLFNPSRKVSARNASSSMRSAAPVFAPPQAFVFSGNEPNMIAGFVSTVKASSESISGFFTAPQLPEGFEMGKPVSPVSAYAASIAVFLGFGAGKTGRVSSANNSQPSPALLPPAGTVAFDFDADGKADFSRWRSSNGGWSVKKSSDNSTVSYTLGSSSSLIVPADYDNDGKADYAVFNPSTGGWTIRKSSTNTDQTLSGFGQSGDKPAVGDFDGDGKADPTVFRPANGTWYVAQSSNSYTVASTQFGQSGDIPVQGDYDGDGALDKAVFRPTGGYWYVLGTTSGFFAVQWGISTDIPVPADYDGDNKTDCSVYRGSTGTWYAYKSSGTGQYISQTWGNYGDQPVPADYDGDGQADFAVWRPKTGNWHVYKSCNYSGTCAQGDFYKYGQLGANGDVPAEASYLKQIGDLVQGYELNAARLSPKNSTGGTDFYSRNFNWGTNLVSLPGRAGLNAGFGMSYNSLVWTKQGTNIYFDADASNISPGFRFGFPVIEPVYYDDDKDVFSYLMVTPSGGRVEFRQLSGASDTYETADSSYVQLKTTGATNPNDPAENITISVTSTDGTKLSYEWKAGAFRCKKITDRNGNYIDINHDDYGLLRTVTDTLGRVITVYYDGELYPTAIKQTWKDNNGAGSNVTHTWATFTYTTQEITTNFNSTAITNNYGPPNGTVLKVLQKVTFPTETNLAGPNTVFTYNTWGQVKQITNYSADNTQLNYAKVNLPADATGTAQTDCPRFTETRSWIKNFNLDQNNAEQEVVVNNSIDVSQTYSLPGSLTGSATLIKVWLTGHPDNLISRIYVGASGWNESLPIATEDCVSTNCSGSDRKRWTWSGWTQDNTSLSYVLNPRVTETRVGDPSNVKKSQTDYYPISQNSPIALYGLVKEVRVYDSDLSTILKKTAVEYNLDTAYTSRRIIGLPSKNEIYGVNQSNNQLELVSKLTYAYDEGDFTTDTSLEQNISTVIQHDNTNYGSSFIAGRGNLTSTTRWNVEYPTSSSYAVTSNVKYNIAGAPAAQINPLGRTIKISYADAFNHTTSNLNTYAYPTKLIEAANTDTNNNFSQIKYRFDIGANVWAKSPKPANNSSGKETTREFDSVGRLLKQTIVNSGAYTRYEYPTNNVQSKIYRTIIDTDNDGADADDEVFAESWTDGAGRVLRSRTEHPGSTGGYSGSLIEYDILGRAKRSTVPTEISVNTSTNAWTPAGDDSTRGWIWNSQQYDWKGRTTRIIPSDSNGSDGKDRLFSYEGCGCAGGEVITVDGESVPVPGQSYSARRRQKIYSDILGRQYKTEVYNWNGTDVYGTTVNTYNGRDQVTQTRQYDGAASSSTYRDMTMSYDGHGRMKTRHYPIENSQAETSWNYNADDSVQQIIDPRGVITNFDYNSRGLLDEISYDLPQNSTIPDTTDVTFAYDALGNRTEMTDGTGSTTYSYNQLSQITSETKTISELSTGYTINYTYNLSGGLKSVSDPLTANHQVNYNLDKIGRTVGADEVLQNATPQNVADTKFRAWGAIKEYDYNKFTNYGTYTTTVTFDYDNRQLVSDLQIADVTGTSTYEYLRYNDGKVQNADTTTFYRFKRYYEYDHAGRFTKGLSGVEAGSDSQILDTPYRTNMSYNAFSDVTSITGKHWGATVRAYSPTVNSQTGRVGTSSYDAAGNVTLERIDSIPTVINRTLAYDAAGRQVQTYDPKQHSWESNITATNTFDGNGWQVKNERSYSGGQVTRLFEIRSTVLGGEVIGRLRYFNQISTPQKKFSVPVNGMKLARDDVFDGGLEWTMPEAIFDFKLEGTAMLDPRGADVGLENPYNTSGGDGGSSYPYYSDATNYARCASGDSPTPCQKLGSIVERSVYQLETAGLLVPPSHNNSSPKSGSGSAQSQAPGHASQRHSPSAQATTSTNKPAAGGTVGSTIEPSSDPSEDGDVVLGPPTGGDGGASVTVRYLIDATFRDSSVSGNYMSNISFGNRRSATTPCATMAKRAQSIADRLIQAEGSDLIFGQDWQLSNRWERVVKAFDKEFTTEYTGQNITDLGDALNLLINEGGKKSGPTSQYGQQDFKEEYLDSKFGRYDTSMDADQVHHFAGFLSMGINQVSLAALVHKSQDAWNNNTGDVNLSNRAYSMGRKLQLNGSNLKYIGQDIMNNICIGSAKSGLQG